MKEVKAEERKGKAIGVLKALLSWHTECFIFELSVALIIASIIAFIYLPVFSAGCIVIPIFAIYYTSLFVWSVVAEWKVGKKIKQKGEK